MNRIAQTFAAALIALGATAATAQHGAKETKEDIQRHRAMAAAHTAVAQCLESGKPHEQCQRDLQAACKNLAIGKLCGMRHVH